jgi:hypothetical protein
LEEDQIFNFRICVFQEISFLMFNLVLPGNAFIVCRKL